MALLRKPKAMFRNWFLPVSSGLAVAATSGTLASSSSMCLWINDEPPLNDWSIHHAARKGYDEGLVEQMLMQMSNYDHLLSLDSSGQTPLTYAALSGRKDIASLLLRQNPDLIRSPNRTGEFPIQLAAIHRHEDVALFLVDSAMTMTQDFFQPKLWLDDFLIVLVQAQFYGVAACIIDKFAPTSRALLEILVPGEYETVLHALANVLHLLAKQVVEADSWSKLVDKVWGTMKSFGEEKIINLLPPVVLVAAEVGNVRFISRIVKDIPNLLFCEDKDGHTIFHKAVIYCRVEVLSFRKDAGSFIDLIALNKDSQGNNLLHHAAKKINPDHQVSETYPILEIKREVEWYKAIRDVLPLCCGHMVNNEGLTPLQLFAEEHEAMLQRNKDWLRRAAKSCLVVVVMIVSLGYGAILNLTQVLDDQLFHKIKVLAATAHVFAIFTSLLCVAQFWHLGIWNFSVEQFTSHIPRVLFLGVVLLFISTIAVLEVAFSTFLLKFSDYNIFEAVCWVNFLFLLVAILVSYRINKYFSSDPSRRAIRAIFQK
ncbi:hypothetical protein C2S52_013810 [Perilla frutescens var. hirtella]|nr:hypothetical protein C2S52_013810 [Perilla frutescens var. hirtella]